MERDPARRASCSNRAEAVGAPRRPDAHPPGGSWPLHVEGVDFGRAGHLPQGERVSRRGRCRSSSSCPGNSRGGPARGSPRGRRARLPRGPGRSNLPSGAGSVYCRASSSGTRASRSRLRDPSSVPWRTGTSARRVLSADKAAIDRPSGDQRDEYSPSEPGISRRPPCLEVDYLDQDWVLRSVGPQRGRRRSASCRPGTRSDRLRRAGPSAAAASRPRLQRFGSATSRRAERTCRRSSARRATSGAALPSAEGR